LLEQRKQPKESVYGAILPHVVANSIELLSWKQPTSHVPSELDILDTNFATANTDTLPPCIASSVLQL
jgi:hypothetical protein